MAEKSLTIKLLAKDLTAQGFKSAKEASEKFALAITGLSAGLGFAVKEFADFEKGMSGVKAITGASGKDFDNLNDLAKKMGATTAFTAKEASEAMQYLGMAGFNTEQIIESLESTLSLAAASNIDLGRAADIASNILTGFQLEAGQAGRVVDVMAKTITTSNTDMEQLSEAMKYFAPTASAFGVSLEEASAAVGLLGNAGIQGSLATRAFGTALTRLTNPTEKMYSIMNDLDLKFFDAKGSFIGLAGMVGILEDKLSGATDEYKQFVLSSLFGMESIQEMNVLLNVGSDQLKKYTKELEGSEGAAKKMADTQLDNLSGSFTLLKSAVSGAMIEIGSKLAPAIRQLADYITEITPKLVSFTDFLIEHKQVLVMVAGAITGGLTLALKGLIITFAQGAIALAPWMIGGAIIAGLIYGIVSIVKNWEQTKESLGFLWDGIKALWGSATDWMKEKIDSLAGWIKDLVDKIKDALSWFNKFSLSNIGDAFKNLPTNLGFGGGKAIGGAVKAGTAYLVGERGPELFTPGASGFITPNHRLAGAGGINITITGNTLLDKRAGEKIGDLIVKKLGLSNKL